jgi:hypothetical protein
VRLRWLFGLEHWPDWSWLLIGAAMLLIGLAIGGYAVLALTGFAHAPLRRGAWTALGLLVVGGAFVNAGWTEATDAVARMRGKPEA